MPLRALATLLFLGGIVDAGVSGNWGIGAIVFGLGAVVLGLDRSWTIRGRNTITFRESYYLKPVIKSPADVAHSSRWHHVHGG